MKRNPNKMLMLAAALCALGVCGCSKQEPPPPPPPAAKPAPKPKPAEPGAAVQKQLSSARPAAGAAGLDFSRRIDPFKPYAPVVPQPQAKAEEAPGAAPRPAADLLPIQSFETGKFRVAGIIAGLRENRALVLDPNGKGYVVQQGMQIGSNDGHISRITSSSVEVLETFKDDRGRIKKRTIVLPLAKKR